MHRRTFLNTFAVATASLSLGTAALADWKPRRPLNVIVPYSAGGGVDSFARAFAAAAEKLLPVPVVIVNRPGSAGLVGAQEAASARPDGNTIMITSAGSFLMASTLRKADVNPFDSFQTVSQIGNLVPGLFVPANSPYQTANELAEDIKARPGALRWAHTGRGSFLHVAGQGFLNANDLEVGDVPFKGGANVRAAIIGEQVDFGFVGVNVGRGFESEMRALAVSSPQRDGIMSEVPTFAELGLNFLDVSSPIVTFAPNGVDAEIVSGIEALLAQVTQTEEFAELMLVKGNAPAYLNGADAEAKLQAMLEAAGPILENISESK
ncbi:tripartite tricarboxylate transporter substrate binding protein [Cognatishimia sp. 1_MG-2023]|uniref:tripartite tricarboxylate transporter substrate binding protein n=1 Tax=Cognatishimia sp. 1_MG-2023 TaxID=3062642 RepID=UPI0026E4924F|nr:tripartite tricarboxylate transporter substrate binding protein [Cognatishimia sp. 1_MG-2023]MDO6728254.1 tripartite tricarboxylate transporter substrate binding protein [Cognatishimia sp. 1_MG-2023]